MMLKATVIINILVVIATVMAYFSPVISPLSFWPAAFAGLIFPILIFLNIVFILLWISFRKPWFLLSLVCLIAGWNQNREFIHLRFPKPHDQVTGDSILHVASFNALRLYRLEPREEGFAKRLRSLKASLEDGTPLDILCLQEAILHDTEKNVFNFPHTLRIDQSPVHILSKFPIVGSGVFRFDDEVQFCGWADIRTPHGTIRVYNLHLYSNLLTNEAEQLMEERNFRESQTWYEASEILKRYRRATMRRTTQAETIGEHIAESPYPTLVCGDFNDVPLSYVYHQIKGDLSDSFESCGSGIGATYNGRIPGLRIDHILADEHFTFLSHRIVKGNYSDHFPVVSKVRIR